MLLRSSFFAVTWSLLFALCLGQQYVYFSATGTQDWKDVAALSDCDINHQCTILSSGSTSLSDSTVIVIEPGSFLDSTGNAVTVALSFDYALQVTFQYPSGELPSFGNAISGLNLQVTGIDGSVFTPAAVTLSSISFSGSILSFTSVGQVMANTTYLNQTTVTITRCAKTIILDSHWISLESSSLLTLSAYRDTYTNIIVANSLDISNLVATCSSTAPCRHFAAICPHPGNRYLHLRHGLEFLWHGRIHLPTYG